MKRLNPLTGLPFAMGDVREDGRVFQSYIKNRPVRADGTFIENWATPIAYFRSRISSAASNAAGRARALGIPYDIDTEYLLSIYPLDGLCPVLKTPLSFGGSRWNSPSLDRLIPSLGYVRGNLCWISDKANTLKQDMTDPEVFISLAKYMRSGCTTQHRINPHGQG